MLKFMTIGSVYALIYNELVFGV